MPDPLVALANVARGLGPLVEEVVFIGGAVAPLMISDAGSEGVRPTDDVDVIVGSYSRTEHSRLEASLRERGFKNDTSDGAPICRYLYDGIPVDVMPVGVDVLGFSNRWYRYALESSEWVDLRTDVTIRVVTPVAFVATKLEAFRSASRQNAGDLLASHDLEDLLTVMDGRPEFEAEASRAPDDVRAYLSMAFSELLAGPDFIGAIEGHLAPGPTRTERARSLVATLRHLAAGGARPPAGQSV